MTARPIIFSAPMIRALLDGQKTQTRRIAKLNHAGRVAFGGRNWHCDDPKAVMACPYGQPGDFLWVRESWSTARLYPVNATLFYRADGDCEGKQASLSFIERERKWRPSIHMPRWASRLTLRITDVRVQRLQEISEADARAEGCSARPFPGPWWQGYRELNGALVHEQAIGDQPPDWMIEPKRMADTPHLDLTAVDDFRSVWHSIHGPDSWSANPWVWALTFDVIHKNIDEVVDDD